MRGLIEHDRLGFLISNNRLNLVADILKRLFRRIDVLNDFENCRAIRIKLYDFRYIAVYQHSLIEDGIDGCLVVAERLTARELKSLDCLYFKADDIGNRLHVGIVKHRVGRPPFKVTKQALGFAVP